MDGDDLSHSRTRTVGLSEALNNYNSIVNRSKTPNQSSALQVKFESISQSPLDPTQIKYKKSKRYEKF
jgi:hypothetical protein